MGEDPPEPEVEQPKNEEEAEEKIRREAEEAERKAQREAAEAEERERAWRKAREEEQLHGGEHKYQWDEAAAVRKHVGHGRGQNADVGLGAQEHVGQEAQAGVEHLVEEKNPIAGFCTQLDVMQTQPSKPTRTPITSERSDTV